MLPRLVALCTSDQFYASPAAVTPAYCSWCNVLVCYLHTLSRTTQSAPTCLGCLWFFLVMYKFSWAPNTNISIGRQLWMRGADPGHLPKSVSWPWASTIFCTSLVKGFAFLRCTNADFFQSSCYWAPLTLSFPGSVPVSCQCCNDTGQRPKWLNTKTRMGPEHENNL